ncbi:hypothetical protein HZS_2753 [Henneguya salminicola]|nr:hypothetical protein HZS_2753 [Henneguya salminicola]
MLGITHKIDDVTNKVQIDFLIIFAFMIMRIFMRTLTKPIRLIKRDPGVIKKAVTYHFICYRCDFKLSIPPD